MSDPKTQTSHPTTPTNPDPNAILTAANGTTAPQTDTASANKAANTNDTGEQNASKPEAAKTSASKSNARTPKRNTKSTANKQSATRTKAGKTQVTAANSDATDTTWFFTQWQDTVDKQLSALRENINNWPGKAIMNMDDSKTAMNDAADNLKECSETLTEGMRHMNHHVIDNMQTDVNRVLEMTRALLDAKTVEEAVEIQSGFMHETTLAQLQHTRELSEMAIQATKDSLEPFSETWQNFYANMTKQAGK